MEKIKVIFRYDLLSFNALKKVLKSKGFAVEHNVIENYSGKSGKQIIWWDEESYAFYLLQKDIIHDETLQKLWVMSHGLDIKVPR